MNTRRIGFARLAAVAGAIAILGGCQQMNHMMGQGDNHVTLTGANEVPPVSTSASGRAEVKVRADRTVDVEVHVSGMTPTAAHIHEAAAGANGPVIVPLNKVSDSKFESAAGAKLTEAQYESYKAGRTYVNVHSAKNPGGEIRAQLKGN